MQEHKYTIYEFMHKLEKQGRTKGKVAERRGKSIEGYGIKAREEG